MSLSSMSRVYNMSAELWWRWNQEVCYWITPSVQGHLLGSYNFLLVSTCCNLWSFIFFICHCSISSVKKIQSKFASSVISYRKWVELRGEPGSCEWHLSPILWQLSHITSHHKVWLQIQGAPAHDNVLQRQLSGLGGQIRITLRYMRKTVGGGVSERPEPPSR